VHDRGGQAVDRRERVAVAVDRGGVVGGGLHGWSRWRRQSVPWSPV
jgi:hypothetical protein